MQLVLFGLIFPSVYRDILTLFIDDYNRLRPIPLFFMTQEMHSPAFGAII